MRRRRRRAHLFSIDVNTVLIMALGAAVWETMRRIPPEARLALLDVGIAAGKSLIGITDTAIPLACPGAGDVERMGL